MSAHPPFESSGPAHGRDRFRHEAFLYAGEHGFLAGTLPILRQALGAGEPVLVAVPRPRVDLLRDALGADAGGVHFVDMLGIGANPARIIPLWQEFVARHGDRGPLLGIGEPVHARREGLELAECYVHESLLNVAFADGPPWSLLCPYDVQALPPGVVDRALAAHPLVRRGPEPRANRGFQSADGTALSGMPLDEPPGDPPRLTLRGGLSPDAWSLLRAQAGAAGVDGVKADDLVLAADAVAREGLEADRPCTLRVWCDEGRLTCELRGGPLTDPLAGRRMPVGAGGGNRGLWLANQLCDLVELRWLVGAAVVRLHMRR